MTPVTPNSPVPAMLSSPQAAIDAAKTAAPGMKVVSVTMPGTPFAGSHHYGIFLSGDQPLTSRLIKPVLINAADGTVSDTRDLPWYAKALFISKPLHFGDYGGMPLKIIWAVLDLITLIVLGSRLYLWAALVLGAYKDAKRVASNASGYGAAMKSAIQRRSVARIFFASPVIAFVSAVGLLTALLGDGIWDVASWLALAIPAIVVGFFALRRQIP
jgi:uncharacterized iron-regulated membrane protein